jgi:uncharacterized linocin/CFP29 family protein
MSFTKPGGAEMDFIQNGNASGSVAQKFLAANCNPEILRANATTLLPKEWEEIDTAIVAAARGMYKVIPAARADGGIKQVNGLARTVLTWNTVSEGTAAELSMRMGHKAANDRPEYVANYLPLPIIHKDFSFDMRELNTSRNFGDGLDVTGAEEATRKVVELAEQVIVAGASSYAAGGGTIYGWLDHPNRNSVTLSTYGNWDASGGTGAQVLKCVNAMIQASINDNYYGPWRLWLPQAYASVLNYRYNAYTGESVGDILSKLAGIVSVDIHPKMTSNKVALVPTSPLAFDIVMGLDVTNIPWNETPFQIDHKVCAIFVPRVKPDQSGNTGLVIAA